jgi:hypothetical protein
MSETFNTRGQLTRRESMGMRNVTNVPVGFVVRAVCSNVSIRVRQAKTTVAPNGSGGFHLLCPRGERAIGGGFFGTDLGNSGQLALADFYRTGSRIWTVAAKNLGNSQVPWVAGEVCLR